MERPDRRLSQLLLRAAAPLASILLLLAGIIELRAQILLLGAICVLLSIVGFILSVRLLETKPFTTEEIEALRPWRVPTVQWAAVASLLVISVIYVADNFKDPRTDRIAALAWLGSVILGFYNIWGVPGWVSQPRVLLEKLRANRLEIMLLSVVILLALTARTFGLFDHPYPWSGDEASIGTEANRILKGETTNLFDTGWSSQPNWSFLLTAISELFLGMNILAVRLPSVLAGTLAVLFLYLAAREFFNPTIALVAAAFLATLPYNVHFSRIGVHNVFDSLMSSLIFWLIARAIKTDDLRYYYSAGAVGGLCIYTYAGTRLALILGGIAILFLIVREKSFLYAHWRHLIAFSTAVVVSVAPQAAYFAGHPDIFMGRLGQEGILFNGWLTQQAALTGKSIWEILADQAVRTVMVFIASSAPGNFFNSPIPYLTVLGSILFLLGMGYALAFLLEPRHFILLIWFWAVVLLGGILTLNPPANTRLLMTSPAVALLMALGAYKVLEYLQRFRVLPVHWNQPLLFLVVAVISYQNLSFYLVEYRDKNYFQDANGEYAMEVAHMASERGKDFQVYILSAPRVFSNFPTFAFVAPDNLIMDLSKEAIPGLVLPTSQEVGFFATLENRPLIQEIIRRFPGGSGGLVYRRSVRNEILFEYYILEP